MRQLRGKWFRCVGYGGRFRGAGPNIIRLVLRSMPSADVILLHRMPNPQQRGWASGWGFSGLTRPAPDQGEWFPTRWQAMEHLRAVDATLRLGGSL